ncbi:MAG: hypothetical protein U0183_06495 [Polyangiaceae bacterium]
MTPWLRFALLAPALVACSVTTTESDDSRGCSPDTGPAVASAVCGSDTVREGPVALGGTARIGVKDLAQGADVPVRVETDRPEVVRVVETSPLSDGCKGASVRVTGLAEGKATVTFRANDGGTRTVVVEVLAPRRLELSPYLVALASKASLPTVDGKRPEPPPPTTSVLQVEGGRATWETKLFAADGRALVGRGATTYTVPPGVGAEPVALETDRELTELSAASVVAGKLEARAGVAELVVPMEVVPRARVATISLYAQAEDPANPEKGTPRYLVLALAKSADGALLHGAPFDFALEGTSVGPGGELFAYDYDKAGTPRELVATVTGSGARASVGLRTAANPSASRSAGHEYAGCNAGRGLSGAPLPLFVAALVLSWVRRRRDRAA